MEEVIQYVPNLYATAGCYHISVNYQRGLQYTFCRNVIGGLFYEIYSRAGSVLKNQFFIYLKMVL